VSLLAVIVIIGLACALAFTLWGWAACHLGRRCDDRTTRARFDHAVKERQEGRQ
jgi:hypothetical protein